jgi:outer membrane protein assembly factor BamB
MKGVEVMRLPRIRSFLAVAAVSMLVLALVAPAAVAAGPTLERSPSGGPPGTVVTLTGEGFQPGEIVDVFLDERDLTVVAAGNRGRVAGVQVEVPRDTGPGTHWFTLLGRHTLRGAQVSFDASPSAWTSWPQRGADAGRTGAQPSESSLTPETVGGLAAAWDVDAWGEPLVVGRTVIAWRSAGYESAELVALDAWTGEDLWANAGFYESSLSTWDGNVLVSSGRKLTALDLRSGALLWSRNIGPRNAWGWGSPSIDGDLLYAAFDGDAGPTVVAYDLRALAPAWETPIAAENRWLNQQPSVGGGVVVGAFGHGLDAFDAATGDVLWSRPSVGYASSMVVSGDRVFAVMDDGDGQVLESRVLTTGALDWHVTLAADGADYAYAMEPAVAAGVVVVAWSAYGGAPESHELTAYDAASGARVWRRSLAASSPPSIANGMAFVSCSDGRLHVVGLTDGQDLAVVLIGVGGGRAAIANGTVYLPGWNSTLYAVRPAGPPRPDPAALVPRKGLTPDQIQPVQSMTAGWTDVASMPRTSGVAATSSTEFHGALYVGTALAPDRTGGAQILRSEDGVTFAVAAAFPGATSVDVESFGGRLYAATQSPGGASLQASTDGAVFTTIGGLPTGGGVERYLPVAAGGRMLVTADTSTGIRMWRSTDGLSFSESERVGGASETGTEVAEPFAPYEHGVVFEGVRYVGVRTPDGGELWRTTDGTTLERVPLTDLGRATWRSVEPQAVFEGSMYLVAVRSAASHDPSVHVYRTADGVSFERVNLPGVTDDPGRYASAQIAEVDGRLILVSGNRDPRRFGTTGSPLETELTHGFQVFASDDGATWQREGEPGFGDEHDWTGMLLVADGTAYLAVTNHREGDAVWRSTDGLAWQPMFREAEQTPSSLGPMLTLYRGHLLLLHGDLRQGLTVYRTDEAVAPVGAAPTTTGWLAVALALAAAVLAVGFVVITASRGGHRPAHRGRGPLPRAA